MPGDDSGRLSSSAEEETEGQRGPLTPQVAQHVCGPWGWERGVAKFDCSDPLACAWVLLWTLPTPLMSLHSITERSLRRHLDVREDDRSER